MDRKKNSGDFFSYEATGDSEADINYDPNNNMDYEDNDDAMSCSYDGSAVNEHDDDDEKRSEDVDEEKDVVYGTSYCSEEEDDDDDEKNNEIHIDQYKKKKKKCYVSFDSGNESMDEMEKNKRFWEACLAS